MRFFYDTEFIDTGQAIEFVSIGAISDDGHKYYAVNRNIPWERLASGEPWAVWLKENVWPKLPLSSPGSLSINIHHPDVKSKSLIAEEFSAFIRKNSDSKQNELWADWPSYDHVVLAQLYGRMMDLPPHIPKRTNCLTQLAEDWGIDIQKAPTQMPGTEHHALEDAMYDRVIFNWIRKQATHGRIRI